MKKNIIKSFIFSWFLVALFTITVLTVSAFDHKEIYNYKESKEEFRATWVASVYNMDIDAQVGTSKEAQDTWKKKYLALLDNAQANNLNAIIFQVRPANDAFYPSKYNPWSEFMAGFGVDPGWDPLLWMIDVTHARGLEYHAWLNPYRAAVSKNFTITKNDEATGFPCVFDYDQEELKTAKSSFFSDLKQRGGKTSDGQDIKNPIFTTGEELYHSVVMGTEGRYVLNPSADSTITLLNNTIEELVDNYDLDGIHFDDYFYPDDTSYKGISSLYKGKTFSTEPNVDYGDYLKYTSGGGTLSLYDWRRDNVDNLIKNLSTIIRTTNKTKTIPCQFGISPCGRWAPSVEACPNEPTRGAEGGMDTGGCYNYYAYSDLFANVKKWIDEDYIDYVVPQVYVNLKSGNYDEIVSWWSNAMQGKKCKLYIGTGLYLMKDWVTSGTGNTYELCYQIRQCQLKNYRVDGFVFFNEKALESGRGKTAMEYLVKNMYKNDALTPLLPGASYKKTVDVVPSISRVEKIEETTYELTFDTNSAKAIEVIQTKDDVTTVLQRSILTEGKMRLTMPQDGSNYFFRYYNEANEIVDTVPISFDDVYINVMPQVSNPSALASSVLISTVVNWSVKISDENNDPLHYTFYMNYRESLSEISSGDVTKFTSIPQTIDVSWNSFGVETKELSFVVKVTDGKNETTYTSQTFNVLETLPIKNYTISYNLDGGTTTNPSTISEKQSITLTDGVKEGYIFDGWFTDSSFTTKVIKIDGTTLTEDITLYAKFTKKPENKSCGCKNSSSLIFYTFALIVLGVGILRKKEDL